MTKKNPWIPQGISIFDPDSMLPIVGQKELFRYLLTFKQEILAHSKVLTGFFGLAGGWGVGKSRVGHEVCLEAINPDAEWIVERRGQRLLAPGLQEGILPLFLRYSHVTDDDQLKRQLSYDTWIPVCAYRALQFLVEPPTPRSGSISQRNQSRITDGLITLLNSKGLERHRSRLREALDANDCSAGVADALGVLNEVGVRQLLVIIDEIEDVTDVEREGLKEDDRKGIDEAFLTVIPRVIKREDVRLEFPQVNFLLLTARSVNRMIRDLRALERRFFYYELQSNAFHDVEDYFHYIRENRPPLWESMKGYADSGLKEAAFLAANRNFGWFNVIMAYCHENQRGGKMAVPELLRTFADFDARGERSVFDVRATGDSMIPPDRDKPRMLQLIYGQLPQRIGTKVMPDEADRLFRKRYSGTDAPLFSPLLEVDAPRGELPRYLRTAAGFKWEEGSIFTAPGEGRFDLDVILASLGSYSIGLPEEDRSHLLIPESQAEFTEQLRSLTPYDNEAVLVAEPLHRFLTQPAYRVQDGEQDRRYLAPSFSFLLHFNRLNKRTQADTGYLRDPRLNTALEERVAELRNDRAEWVKSLMRGAAQTWEEDHVIEGSSARDLQCPSLVFSSERPPLSLGAGGQVTLLYVSGSNESATQLQQDLQRLAPRPERPAHPVLLIVEGAPNREDDLSEEVHRQHRALAPFIIVRALSPYQAEVLVRQGLMGQVFQPNDLRTNQFTSGVALVRQHLRQALEGSREQTGWLARLDKNGLVLRPIFFRKSIIQDDFRVLATGYARMLTGARTYEQLIREDDDTFSPDDRDLFRKRANEHVRPPAKYEGQTSLGLFEERGGTLEAKVPRPLVTLLERIGVIARTPAQLEPLFLYAASDPRPQDVVRQFCSFLEAVGFLNAEGAGKYRRVSGTLLRDGLAQCEEWLTGSGQQNFRRFNSAIKAIHRAAADELEARAKQAREEVERARSETADLSLQFLERSWDELEETQTDPITGGKLPIYVAEFRQAVASVARGRALIERIYNPLAFKELLDSYSPDLLAGFEVDRLRDDYPLWKRVAILSGFYTDLARLRAQLLERIKEQIRLGHDEMDDGPGGQKVFPTQALTLMLKAWRDELNFPSDHPQQTVRAGVQSVGSGALGVRLSLGKYREAWNRLQEIEGELTRPDRAPQRYFESAKRWRALLEEQQRLAEEAGSWERFFADAGPEVRRRFRIEELAAEVESLCRSLHEGVRAGTDEREAAGQSVFELVKGLEADLEEVAREPAAIQPRLQGLEQGILEALVQEFEEEARDILGAYQRIRTAQRKSLRGWPSSLGVSYGMTRRQFEQAVKEAEEGVKAYFADVSELSWQDYVALCRMDAAHQDISWEQEPFRSYVAPLQRKGLVKLRLT
jgi:hypothetical protein